MSFETEKDEDIEINTIKTLFNDSNITETLFEYYFTLNLRAVLSLSIA